MLINCGEYTTKKIVLRATMKPTLLPTTMKQIIRKLGDQRIHFQQHLQAKQRIGGDQKFYQNPSSYRDNKYGHKHDAMNYNSRISGYSGRRRTPNEYGVHFDRYANSGSGFKSIDWSKVQLPHIRKNLYSEHAAITQRDQSEIREWLIQSECTLRGKDIPRPVFDFTESGFPEPIIKHLSDSYDKPTTIQSISWPVALSGRDFVSIAKTGSGKTLGFILPAILHIMNQDQRKSREGPSVLVMLPTRELALQLQDVANEYRRFANFELACCYGGSPRHSQQVKLHRGIDICLATPGRIMDFMESGAINMHRCSYLVLDEADRMLDMGFEPQIRKIISQIRPDRQTMMFSATWPKEIRELAADFHQDPVHLQVGSLELSANHNIRQHVEVIQEHEKESRLQQLLGDIMKEGKQKTLIFVQTKRNADGLTRSMRRSGLSALCIHGDKSQSEREWVLTEFKEDRAHVLIATDVAARGLDVNDIKYVINYDYPNSAEDYVHRIGRTGRVEKTGTSYTFFTPLDAPKAGDLIKLLEEAQQIVPDSLRNLIQHRRQNMHHTNRRY